MTYLNFPLLSSLTALNSNPPTSIRTLLLLVRFRAFVDLEMEILRKSEDVLPPDEKRCRRTDGKKWRCKNIISNSHDPSHHCDQHTSWYQRWYRSNRKDKANTKKQKSRKLTDILNSSADEVQGERRRVETKDNNDDQLRNCSSEEGGLLLEEETQESLETILRVCKTKFGELLVELEKKTVDGIHEKLVELEDMKIAAEDVLEKLKNRGELKEMGKDMESERRKQQDEVEFWRSKFNDLEARVLRMESNSIVVDPPPPANNGEEENVAAEFSGGRHHVSNEDEIDTHRQVEVEVGKVNSADVIYVDSDDESVVELESSKNKDGENVGQSLLEDADSIFSLGGAVMDNLGMKWESEADMLSSFEEDPELCMEAVCALYRQPTFKDKSANGLDAHWIKNLAEFLMEGDPKAKGDMKKSVKEFLAKFTDIELELCKKLASSYSEQLFSIYKDKQDPFFLPTPKSCPRKMKASWTPKKV